MILILLSAAGLATLPVSTLDAQEEESSIDDWLGLWRAERSFAPGVQGLLTLDNRGDSWHADIQGFRVEVLRDGDRLRFELPGDRGRFEGRLNSDDEVVSAQWIQPDGTIETYRYATPVSMEQTGPGRWQGRVEPRQDTFGLYLDIRRDEDDGVRAYLRNPERNIGVYMRFGGAKRQGDELLLFDRENESVALRGHYTRDTQQLSIRLPYRGGSYDFTRRSRDQAPGFFPRAEELSRYRYTEPLETDDGWPTATLEEVGLDRGPVEALVQSILDTETDSLATPYVQGVLIARHGKLVLDEYFYGFHRDRPHDSRSSAKSLTSLLVGIASDRIDSFDGKTEVLATFPGYQELAHVDTRKKALTVEHLLTMTSGLDCDDDDYETPGNEDRMQSQSEQQDWYRYTLDLPMVRDPGESAVYCTAGINLLGGLVSRATEQPLTEFVAEHYAQPLDIHRYHLNLSPTGVAYMGGGVRMRPRDHLKMAQLVLDGGRWRDRQIVSEDWIELSTAAHASIHSEGDYGYGWWRQRFEVEGRTVDAIYASGNGGQLVFAVPELDLAVAFTGGNYSNFPVWRTFRDELLPRYILSAALPEGSEEDSDRQE